MLDYQRIVDDVRNSLYRANVEGADALRAPAAEYQLASQEVAERLRHCGNLLRQGLRSEALQLAEVEPNLLDVVATLDFPERAGWQQLIQSVGIVAPPPLPIDVAADLNEAYALEQPLTVLLQRHRLLAMARAPLQGRIAVMRQLAAVDTNNSVWAEDLVIFERERQKEIQSELAEAAQAGDLTTLTAVAAELTAEPWLEMPPSPLIHWAEETRNRVAGQCARRELVRIERQLNEAHAALDEPLGQRLRVEWNSCQSACPLTDDDPLSQQAAPALEWLDECDRRSEQQSQHEQAIGRLEAALDSQPEPTLAQLERLHAMAVRLGEEVPVGLESRYRSRVASLQMASTRRSRLMVSACVAGALLVAAGVGAAIWYPLHWREIETQAAAIESLIAAGKLTEASAYVERLTAQSPELVAEARLQKVQADLESLVAAEQDRQVAFRQTLAVASDSVDEQPDLASLAQAKKLARTAEEKSQVLQVEAKLLATTRGAQAARDATFSQSIDGLISRLQELSRLSGTEPAALLAKTKDFKEELKQLDNAGEQVSASLRQQTKPLWTRLAAIETAAKNSAAEEADLAAVTRTIGKADDFRAALQRFAKLYPQSTTARDFQRAAEESSTWKHIDDWNTLAAAWSRKQVVDLDAAGATAYLELATKTLQTCGQFPDAGYFRARLPYLEAVVLRGSDAERIDAKLKQVLGDTLVSSVNLVEHKDGRRYYTRFKPTFQQGKPSGFKYLSGFNLEEKLIAFKQEDISFADLAPHAKTAEAAKKRLLELADGSWEPTFFNVAKVVVEDKQMDPLLKLALLQQSIEIGSQGSPCLQKAFAAHLQLIRDANINPFANWLDPTDREVQGFRAQAATVLDKLPDVAAVGKVAAAELQKLRGLPGTTYRWVGLLSHGPGADWRVRTSAPLPQVGSLFVIRPGVSEASLEKVGELRAGAAVIDTTSPERLLQGRPVFLAVSSGSGPAKK